MMGMNFRETTALLREAESRDKLAAALKGGKAAKEFRSEREALEKAAGGKKRLEQADKVLTDARTEAEKIVGAAEEKTGVLRRSAAGKIKAGTAALDGRQAELDALKTSLDALRASLGVKSQEADDAAKALDAREKSADIRDGEFTRRESAVSARETRATAREAEIQRFDAWRATAPA